MPIAEVTIDDDSTGAVENIRDADDKIDGREENFDSLANRLIECFNLLRSATGPARSKLSLACKENDEIFHVPTSICDTRWHCMLEAFKYYVSHRYLIETVMIECYNDWWLEKGFEDDDVKSMEDAVPLLDDIKELSDMLSGETYPTIHQVASSLAKLKKGIDEHLGDDTITPAARNRFSTMQKYVINYYYKDFHQRCDVFFAAAYLDPSKFISHAQAGWLHADEYAFDKFDPERQSPRSRTVASRFVLEEAVRLEDIRKNLKKNCKTVLGSLASKNSASISDDVLTYITQHCTSNTAGERQSENFFAANVAHEFEQYCSNAAMLYEEALNIPSLLDKSNKVDPVKFWSSNLVSAYSRIRPAALAILGISASSAASERLFSEASYVLTKGRGKLIDTFGPDLVAASHWVKNSTLPTVEKLIKVARESSKDDR